MIIKTLASSSAGNCYLVDDGKTRLLLDAGIKFTAIQQALDYRTNEISGCLISHVHGDHTKAVPQLLRRGVKVYGPQEAAAAFEGVQGIPALKPRGVGTFDVIPFHGVHDAEVYGYQISSLVTGEKLVYLTDSQKSTVQFSGVTHLLIEANHDTLAIARRIRAGELTEKLGLRIMETHMSIDRAKKLVESMDQSRLQEVRLIHLSNEHSDAAAFVEKIKAKVGDGVLVTAEG